MPAPADLRLLAHRASWQRKAALRVVYADYYRILAAALPKGPVTLEVGAGAGHSLGLLPATFRMDILPSPWVDVVADAHALPFADETVDGIAMLDVVHHLACPARFFEEAARILRPGGRLAMIEPGITPLSWLFYNFLHHEPVDMQVDPLADPRRPAHRNPFESNQAIPTLLFTRQENRLALRARIPELRVVSDGWLSLIAYPLTGGFKSWALISARLARWLLRIEERLLPVLGAWAAFRLFVVLEKSAEPKPTV
jgi:SAM-dependent methyltransferase